MIYLLYAICTFALLPFVWLFYLAIMSLSRAAQEGKLSTPATLMGYPILLVGYLLDFLGNMTFACILFVDIPREWLISARLQRYANEPDSWRRRLALWFARGLLNPFDPKGYHIKE